ncbi:MAG: DUF5818 domain-containing protein [Candidatus Sulfotelmatobacter sp.]
MKYFLLVSVLMLGASWAVAQSYPSQGSAGSTTGQHSVVGCLSSSGGAYTLTAKNGKTYDLTGDTAKLSDHVGHEMKITGTMSPASASSSDAMSKNGGEETIDVTSFKHISRTCSSGAMSH